MAVKAKDAKAKDAKAKDALYDNDEPTQTQTQTQKGRCFLLNY